MNFVFLGIDGCPARHGDGSGDRHWFGEGDRCWMNDIANHESLICRRNIDNIAWPYIRIRLLLASKSVLENVIVNLIGRRSRRRGRRLTGHGWFRMDDLDRSSGVIGWAIYECKQFQ